MSKLEGFDDLVKMAMKERPEKPKNFQELWNKFLYIVFMGGKRSDPEINFLINILNSKKLLDFDYVKKTDGEDWRDAVTEVLKERIPRINDEEVKEMVKEFEKELFRISASIKGSARFFDKNHIDMKKLEDMLSTEEKTKEFIESLAKDEDVSNIKYTKVIIWLHSIGLGQDSVPPSWQTKKFINDEIGPYYQFYDDDKYFMEKGVEFANLVKKKIKGCTARDVSAAMFYYITLKSMLLPRSIEKKKFTSATLIKFLKSKKMTLKQLSENLADFDERHTLMEEINDFAFKSIKVKSKKP